VFDQRTQILKRLRHDELGSFEQPRAPPNLKLKRHFVELLKVIRQMHRQTIGRIDIQDGLPIRITLEGNAR